MFIVYKHTCVENEKAYVGFTPQTPILTSIENPDTLAQYLMEKRWLLHVYDTKRGSDYAFHNAIRKHGFEAFSHEVLEQCSTREAVVEREIAWIAKLNTMVQGYNMTPGGDGVIDLTPEHRARQKQATIDAMWRPDVRKNLLAAAKNEQSRQRKSVSVTQSWTRKDVRERHRNAMETSEAVALLRHAICQIDPKSKLVVATYKSKHEASRMTGIPYSSIQAHLKGRLRHAGGFIWAAETF